MDSDVCILPISAVADKPRTEPAVLGLTEYRIIGGISFFMRAEAIERISLGSRCGSHQPLTAESVIGFKFYIARYAVIALTDE